MVAENLIFSYNDLKAFIESDELNAIRQKCDLTDRMWAFQVEKSLSKLCENVTKEEYKASIS